MLSVRFDAAYKVSFNEIGKPLLKNNEVLLKMLRIGVCGTDIQVYMGKNKFMKFPIVPFHEGIAEIVEVGNEIEGLSLGDRVVVEPLIPCGKCRPCEIGRYNACDEFTCLGVQTEGLGSEYFAIESKHIHRIPKELTLEKAVLIEPFAVGVHAAKRGNVQGANVLVVGAGTIGNFTAQAAKALGAKKVVVTDISDFKIELAQKCGIESCVNTSNSSLKQVIKVNFGKWGADVIIDCVGVKRAFEEILNVAGKATTIVIVGNHKEPVEIDLTKIQRNEIDIKGNITYTKEDFMDAINWIASDKICTDGFITNIYNIRETDKAMENAVKEPHKVMKTMICFDRLL